MSMITIYGNEEEVLSTKLTELLGCISNNSGLNYLLKHVEGVSSYPTFNQLEFEATIKNAVDGVNLTYDELLNIEERSHQLIEMDLEVYEAEGNDKSICLCTNLIAKLCLIDGAYWEVETSNDLIIQNLLGLDGAEITNNSIN